MILTGDYGGRLGGVYPAFTPRFGGNPEKLRTNTGYFGQTPDIFNDP
ncbi:hypothetical protein VN12_04445 [Pirellula sp. SH-Sr6A]|nr:hypothetical protein VN12_04445 [Pirellula sp. SH-Sr6A]